MQKQIQSLREKLERQKSEITELTNQLQSFDDSKGDAKEKTEKAKVRRINSKSLSSIISPDEMMTDRDSNKKSEEEIKVIQSTNLKSKAKNVRILSARSSLSSPFNPRANVKKSKN
eukprot:TRINITY_DN8044_c0_g1_i3.p1 TRINITY_DN8044_c0_g1~~TRINITY_DN8044_c0_g1_i3.p1  ORF type:complete len:116 (-),score=30.34 TRINITY_DN8044_c0_g1_i3:120-467(-)